MPVDLLWDVAKVVVPIIFAAILYVWKLNSQLELHKMKTQAEIERVRGEVNTLSQRVAEGEKQNGYVAVQLQTVTVMLARLEERIEVALRKDHE